jgi:hypothetical protein
VYQSKIEHLEGGIRSALGIVGDLIDASDYEGAASIQVVIAQDEQTLAELREKLELVSDEDEFNKMADHFEGEVEEEPFLE